MKAHQVRSLAASWARHASASMEDMSACSWKSYNTFSQFYLKDMALICDQMYHLGPVVVALHISLVSIPSQVEVWKTCRNSGLLAIKVDRFAYYSLKFMFIDKDF